MESIGFEISTPDRHDSLPGWGDHGLISDGDMVQKRSHLHSDPCTLQCSAVRRCDAVHCSQYPVAVLRDPSRRRGRYMRAEGVGKAYRARGNLTVAAKALKNDGEKDPSFAWSWPSWAVVAMVAVVAVVAGLVRYRCRCRCR